MGILHRKFGLPVYVTARTHKAAARYGLGEIADLRHFRSGETLRFDKVAVETIPTPHDGADGVVFVVDDGHRRLGILTDLGHVFAGLDGVLESLDAVLLESNYDPEMLADGPYPDWLKDRIRGAGRPHLERRVGRAFAETTSKRLQWACLAHLSQDNNTPAVALRHPSADRRPAAAAVGGHAARTDRRAGSVSYFPHSINKASCAARRASGSLSCFSTWNTASAASGKLPPSSPSDSAAAARTLGSLSLSNSMR